MVETAGEEINITTDRTKLIALDILQRQSDVLNAYYVYLKFKRANANPPSHVIKACIEILWLRVMANVGYSNSDLKKKIKALLDEAKSVKDYMVIYEEIDEFLVQANLTRFIYKRKHDMGNPVGEDEAKGL